MRMGDAVQLHAFLSSALNGSEWSVQFAGCFSSGEIFPENTLKKKKQVCSKCQCVRVCAKYSAS
jgi:hypothetical protein